MKREEPLDLRLANLANALEMVFKYFKTSSTVGKFNLHLQNKTADTTVKHGKNWILKKCITL